MDDRPMTGGEVDAYVEGAALMLKNVISAMRAVAVTFDGQEPHGSAIALALRMAADDWEDGPIGDKQAMKAALGRPS